MPTKPVAMSSIEAVPRRRVAARPSRSDRREPPRAEGSIVLAPPCGRSGSASTSSASTASRRPRRPAQRSSASSRCRARSTRIARASARSTTSQPGSAPMLIEAADINAPEVVAAVGALDRRWSSSSAGRSSCASRSSRLRAAPCTGCTRPCSHAIAAAPRCRGRSSAASRKTGVTLFEITDPTADSGPIVGQVEVPIARTRRRRRSTTAWRRRT